MDLVEFLECQGISYDSSFSVNNSGTFSIHINLNNDSYYFKIDGLKDKDELDMAMDSMLEYFEKLQDKSGNNRMYKAEFNTKNRKWVVKDFLKEKMEENKDV